MPQMLIRRPLHKLELPQQQGPEPPAVFHLGSRQTLTPSPCLCFGKIREGAILDFQWPDPLEQFSTRCRRESTAGSGGIDQLATFVIADDQRVEVFKRW